MASALARLCSRAWRQQQQQHHQRLAASIVGAAPRLQPLPPPPLSSSGFHTSAPMLMGRKGGASAFEKRLPPSAFRAKAALQKRQQEQEQERRRRQAQQRQRRMHPGNRGGSVLPAVADNSHLIDPDFGDLIRELLRPVEDASAPPPPRRIGDTAKARQQPALLLGEGGTPRGLVGLGLSKEWVLGLVEVDDKRAEMAAREAETGIPCPLEEYDRLIRAYGVQDRPDEAVALLREMQDRGLPLTSKTLTAAVYALCRASPPRPEEAEALMVGVEAEGAASPDAWTWTTLVKGYVRARRAGEALAAFKQMKLAGHEQDLAVCTTVLEALGSQRAPGGKDRMLDFWLDMRLHGIEPDAVAYTVMIKALVRTGDIERSLSLMDEMEQMGVEPTIVTYNTVLLAAAEAPLWFPGYNAYVTELLGRLEASNLAPNADTYRALLRVCAQAGNPFLAERYLEQMQGERGLEPGREHYHALLHAYAMAQSAGTKGGRIPKLYRAEDGEGRDAQGGITTIAGRRLAGDRDVEIDLKASAARRALLPAKEGKRGKKQRLVAEAAALLEAEAEKKRRLQTGGAGRRKGTGALDASSLLLAVEGADDTPTAAALAVVGVEGADAYVTVGGQGGEQKENAAVLRGGLLHLLPSERERLALDGLVPLEEGEREVDLVRSRLPKGILVPDLQEANIRAAHAVVAEMGSRGLAPTTETMNHVLAVYAEALRIRRANQLVDEQFTQQPPRARPQEHQPLDDDADADTDTDKTDAALVVPAAGNVTARGSHVSLPQVVADARTYQILVRMLVRAKRLGEAFELVKALRKEKGIAPSADTLGLMTEALGRRGEIKPALHLLEVMKEELGYEPKEWHVRPLRRAMQRRGLRHQLVPTDPKTWLKKGLQLRKHPDKAGRSVRNLVASQMRAGS